MSLTRRDLGALAITAALTGTLAACGGSDGGSDSSTIKVGALATPAGDLLQWIQDNLADDAALTIEWTEFTDYNTPNPALSDGTTDANLFQNQEFLDTYNSEAGDTLISVGEAYLPAAGFYSETLKSLDDLTAGAKIAIPNDPTNEGRALELLASEGVIGTGDKPTTLDDVTENPLDLDFTEVENATLAQTLSDQDAAFVTATFALPAGLTADSAILMEGNESKYYNVLATREELKDDERVKKLYDLLTDEKTKKYMTDTWKGLVVPVA